MWLQVVTKNLGQNIDYAKLQPGLNGALFVIAAPENALVVVDMSYAMTKKREWKTEKLPK